MDSCPGNCVVKHENFTVPSQEFFQNLPTGAAKVDSYRQAQGCPIFHLAEEALAKAKNCAQSNEGGHEHNAPIGDVPFKEFIDLISKLCFRLREDADIHAASFALRILSGGTRPE